MNKEIKRAARTSSGGSSSLCWMIFWMVLEKNWFIVSRFWFGRIRTSGARNGKATGHTKPEELLYRLRQTRGQHKNLFWRNEKFSTNRITAWWAWRTRRKRTAWRGGQRGRPRGSESPRGSRKRRWRWRPWWSSRSTCREKHAHSQQRVGDTSLPSSWGRSKLLVDVKGFSRLGENAEVCHQDVAGRVDERDHLRRSGGDTSKALRKHRRDSHFSFPSGGRENCLAATTLWQVWQESRVEAGQRTSGREQTRSRLTSFILAALNDGVRMLRTRFQASSLRKSRQSDMGLLVSTIFCTHTHRHTRGGCHKGDWGTLEAVVPARVVLTSLFGKLLKSFTITCLSISGSAITTIGLRPK